MRKMKITAFAIMAVSLCIAGCSGKKDADAGDYVVYTSAAHRFSVEVPPKFKNFKIKPQELEDSGNPPVVTYMYQSTLEDMIFMVAATPVQLDEKRIMEALNAGRDAVAKTGVIISRGEGTLAGNPALTLRYKMPSGGMDVYYDGRFAYIGGIEYQVLFGSTSTEKLGRPAAARFFDTFKVNP